MNAASPTSLDLARELFALEAVRGRNAGSRGSGGGGASPPDHTDHAVKVCEKLRAVLTAFAGTSGFRSLLSRALTLAKAQEPSLAAVRVMEDSSLVGLDEVCGESVTSARKAAAGDHALIAHLLDLLILFIGEPLTLQLVRSAWPEFPPPPRRGARRRIPSKI